METALLKELPVLDLADVFHKVTNAVGLREH